MSLKLLFCLCAVMVFAVSLSGNVILYSRSKVAEESLIQRDLIIERMKEDAMLADKVMQEHTKEVQKITQERNSWRSEAKKARETNVEYQKWADTPLPNHIITKYNRLYKKD